MSDGIDPKVLAEAMEGWNEGELKCRGRQRHNWNPYTCFVNARTIDVHEACGNCKARRHRLMNAKTGHWIDPKWKPERWSENYRLPAGAGRLSPDQKAFIRLTEVMSRGRIVEVDE